MIQFNLLPDVKQEYVKARRTKRLVTLASMLVSAVALFVLLLMVLSVDVVQKKSIHDLNSDISKYSKQLKSVPDLDKMLTVQNQLNTLTSLHDQKVVTSRLFGYIAQITPGQTSISKFTVSFVTGTNTFEIQGEAPNLDPVNAFTDTLKATTYSVTNADEWQSNQNYSVGTIVQLGGVTYIATKVNTSNNDNKPGSGVSWKDSWTANPKAFSKVVMTQFGRDSKGATYTIDLNYDPNIFNSANQVNLTVPAGAGGTQSLLFQKQASN